MEAKRPPHQSPVEAPPALMLSKQTFGYKVQTGQVVANAEEPSRTPQKNPSRNCCPQNSFSLFFLPLLCRLPSRGGGGAYGWGVEWEAAWPPGGQLRFMGLDFYRLGRGPGQELRSPTEEQTHTNLPT